MTRRSRCRAVVSLLAVLALASSGEAVAAETSKTVVIEGLKFQPATLTVHQGDTIVWRNRDFFPHNVTAQGGAFKSGDIAASGSWNYKATKKGEFPYICTLHPTMKGTLIVK